MSGGRIELDVLGPVRAYRGGKPLSLGGVRQRALLLRLVLERGGVVQASQLRHDVWPDRDLSDSALRVAVVRLRQALGDDDDDARVVVHRGAGYAVTPDMFELDIDRFETAVARGQSERPGDPNAAAIALREALDLWRGDPFGDVADSSFLAAEIGRLMALRDRAVERYFEAEVALGRGPAVVPELEAAVRDDPLSESLVASVAIALYQSGRQVEALAAYRQHERLLREELGLRPSPRLEHVQQLILNHDDELAVGAPAAPESRLTPMTDRFLKLGAMPFVGREDHLADLRSIIGGSAGESVRAACVAGPPGSGKTHLMAAAVNRTASSGADVVYAACSDGPMSGGQFVFDLARGLGIDLRTEKNSIADPLSRGFELRIAIARQIEEIAQHRALVVVADDLHLADDETASLIEFITDRSPQRVSWLLGCRSDTSHRPLTHLLEHLAVLAPSLFISLEPFEEHEIKSLAVAFGRSDSENFDELVDRVHRLSGGNPLFCVELLRDDRFDQLGCVSDRLATLIVGRLGQVSETARQVCNTLLVAGSDVPVDVLARVCSSSSDEVRSAAQELAQRGILDPPDSHGLRFRHALISGALETSLAEPEASALRCRLVDALRIEGAPASLIAEQLLALPYPSDESARRVVDQTTGDALRHLLAAVDYGSALVLADRYLEVVGTERSDAVAVAALLQVATVLLATGQVDRGRALHAIVLDRTSVIDDPPLRSDALLASGPSALGGTSAARQIEQAEEMLRLLPADEHRRRIQLQCWAAHHHLNLGELADAMDLLDQAQRELAGSPSSSLRALVLSVRVQATHLIGHPFPSSAFGLLRGHAALTGDVVAEAGVALLALGEAFVSGSLDDVAAARDSLADVAEIMPRPDLRWTVLASKAAMQLASGDLESAAEVAADAASFGHRMSVEMAEPVARLQQSLLMWQRREFGPLSEVLTALGRRGDASPLTIVLAAHAAMQAGDRVVACEMFDRLDAFDALLESSAQTWPAVAALTARLAGELGEPEVVAAASRHLTRHLRKRRGTGLAVHGVAYFGTVDLAMAFMDSCSGDPGARVEAFESAAALERDRGMSWWMDEAVRQTRPHPR